MIGRNILILNQATVTKALQDYLDHICNNLTKPIVVETVEEIKDGKYETQGSFKIVTLVELPPIVAK